MRDAAPGVLFDVQPLKLPWVRQFDLQTTATKSSFYGRATSDRHLGSSDISTGRAPFPPTHPQPSSQNEISPDDLTSFEATPERYTLGVLFCVTAGLAPRFITEKATPRRATPVDQRSRATYIVMITGSAERQTPSPDTPLPPDQRSDYLRTTNPRALGCWRVFFVAADDYLSPQGWGYAVCSRVHRNSVPSTHMRCLIAANRRARATDPVAPGDLQGT